MIIDREGQVFDRPDCDGEVADYKVEYLKNEKYSVVLLRRSAPLTKI